MFSKYYTGFTLCALTLAISAEVLAGTVTTDGADIVVKTKGGLEVATTDDQFSFQIGGRIQADFDQFDGVYTQNGKTADSAYLRRARLELSGKAYGVWGYDLAVDLSSDEPIKDAFVSYFGFDPVTLSVGRFDPDFGLENAISSKWTTAMEPSMITDLAPWASDHDEGMGVQVRGATDMFYGSASVLRPSSNENDNGRTRNNYNLRAVFAPMAEAGNVLHLGINYAYSDADELDGRIRTRMGVRGTSEVGQNGNRPDLAPKVTGAFDGDAALGLEFAWATGPFSLQSEYLRRKISAKSDSVRNDRDATGYYGQLAYTLTGESRSYKLDGGRFGSIKPENQQLGAWEVFYRYDRANVEESGFFDNTAKVQTVGVNWYANQAVKVSANYLKAKTVNVSNNNGDDKGDALSLRLQYVF